MMFTIQSVWGGPFALTHIDCGGMTPLCRERINSADRYMPAHQTADCAECLRLEGQNGNADL